MTSGRDVGPGRREVGASGRAGSGRRDAPGPAGKTGAMSPSPVPPRPLVHFAPRAGWVNDPLGLTWHDGRYHLFFQYVPDSTDWQLHCHWGHATSEDLVHWTEHEPALLPGDGDDGVWSGSIAVPDDGGAAALFYTSVTAAAGLGIGRNRVARPLDGSWTRWEKGPVVAELPPGFAPEAVEAYRDPWVVREGGAWWMVVGGGLRDERGGTATAWVYRSTDLEEWTYHGLLTTRHTTETDGEWSGPVWECPQLFPLDGSWVLTLSAWEPDHPHHAVYAVGDFADGSFTARRWSRLTYGPAYYAGSAFADRDGRRGLIHWMRQVGGAAEGWAGAHSVPHLLRLEGDALVCEPHPAVLAARTGSLGVATPGQDLAAASSAVDVVWEPEGSSTLRVGPGSPAPDGGEVVVLEADDTLVVAHVGAQRWEMPRGAGPVRVVLDGPTCEVFTTGGVMGVAVPASAGLRVAVTGGGRAEVHALG
ncbi:glycosyl hydrolase family 32 [Actinotalea ferrariae CF5-4]|uniref:beta-fructofuranosidase n=2 Tax=Actinotalea TaxID=458839 RepID=A0A021VRB8_9CELL|nr:glycosyl hydrolase family 32 [Actinotalea ferrariae CF5-4]